MNFNNPIKLEVSFSNYYVQCIYFVFETFYTLTLKLVFSKGMMTERKRRRRGEGLLLIEVLATLQDAANQN